MPKATQEVVSKDSDGEGLARGEGIFHHLDRELWREERGFNKFVIKILGCSETKYFCLKFLILKNKLLCS